MANGSKKRQPGRPRKKIRRVRLSITLLPHVRDEADRLAFGMQRSLSNLIEQNLIQIIDQHGEDSGTHSTTRN